MRILITGGGGFIGSHIAEFLAQKDHSYKIHVIDNLSRAKLLNPDTSKKFTYNWQYLKKYTNITFYKKDLRDFVFLKELIKNKNFDIIFHTAGQTAVVNSLKFPYLDFENNVIASINLLEAVRISNSKSKLILCSTNKVYGDNVNNINLIEKELKYEINDRYIDGVPEDFKIDLCHHSPYGTSKLCSDLYFQEYGYSYGLDTNIFRISCVYGPRQFGVEAQGWLVHFIISALKNQKITIYGNGKQVRDILYISDLINAFNNLIENNIKNEVFCLGGGKRNSISILELIIILEDLLNKKITYKLADWRAADQLAYISDISKAQEILKWSPIINPKEGIEKTLKWYKLNINLFK